MLEHILDISMVKHAMTTDIPHTSQSTGIYQGCLSIVVYQRYLTPMLKHENLSTAHGKSHDIYTPLIALLLDTVVIVLHIQHTPGLLAECSVSLALCCQLTAGHQVGPTKPMARLELVFFSTFEQLDLHKAQ